MGAKTDEQKGTKRKVEQPQGKLKWSNLHGVSTQDVLALETDSFIQDVKEAAELSTLPLPTLPEGDTANATTVPWMAPAPSEDAGVAHNEPQGEEEPSPGTRSAAEEREHSSPSSPESHRRRRMHSAFFNMHGPI